MLTPQRDRLVGRERRYFGRFLAFFWGFLTCGVGAVASILRSTSSVLGWDCRWVFTFSISPLYIVPEESETGGRQNIEITKDMISSGVAVFDQIADCVSTDYLVAEIYKAMYAASQSGGEV